MNKRILKRLLVLFFVVASSLYLVARYSIPLGLDLRGGVQIALHVLTDDALEADTEATVETIRQEILKTVDKPTKVLSTGIGEIRVTGISLPVLEEQIPGWESTLDTEPGIPAVRLRMGSALRRTLAEDATAQTMRVIENRLNRLGVNEITIHRYGDPADHQIQVQVPGETDPRRIQSILESPGLLQFRIVDSGPFESAAAVAASYGGTPPSEVEVLPSREGPDLYAVQRATSLTGRHLRAATSERDYGKPVVGFALNVEGAERFSKLTEDNIGKQLAIVLDGIVQSAPVIEERIGNSGIIRGAFTVEQVHDLVLVLRSGALPARTRTVHENFVGPSLGEDSIRAGIAASAVALGTVSAFVVAYYRMAGINAVVAMLLNLLILLAAMALLGAPLTLPGIAGVVLTIGMGIDSNVLIFERIREELRAGKTAAAAIALGFRRVLQTLIDTHLAAMISAAILFAFSTGAVRGFAVTLAIGLVSNLFTSVFVSKTLLEFFHRKGPLSI